MAYIQFNRADALNAISVPLAEGFFQACVDIAMDRDVRVVWLSSAGRAFMAGGDLSAISKAPLEVAEALIAGMHGALRLLAEMDAPVVVSVQGAVAGGGLGLMLACDLVIAAQDSRFSLAYPGIGASCDCSTSWGLPRQIGLRRALEFALLPTPIDANEALRLGLINRIVPTDSLEAEVMAFVDQLASGPTKAYGHLKRLMRTSFENSLDTQLDAEAAGFFACVSTADFQEGVTAFLGKKKPRFVGT